MDVRRRLFACRSLYYYLASLACSAEEFVGQVGLVGLVGRVGHQVSAKLCVLSGDSLRLCVEFLFWLRLSRVMLLCVSLRVPRHSLGEGGSSAVSYFRRALLLFLAERLVRLILL